MFFEIDYFKVIIICCCSSSLIGLEFSLRRNSECVQPVLRIDNGGLIQSHRQFGKTLYPINLDCAWLILAPIGYQIMIQFDFINIEDDSSCQYDFVDFINSSNNSHKVCGNDDNKRFISSDNRLTVTFHSDDSTSLEGFTLRYLFVSSLSVSRGLVSLVKSGRQCADDEWKCAYANTCIPKNWVCDNVRDCRDDSDEIACISIRPCHQSQLACSNHQCISKELWCDGVYHCKDKSDEIRCNSTIPLPDPFKPTTKNGCSFQPIQPNDVNINDDNSQIVGGHEVIPGSWPWMISLRYGNTHICGASLLSDRWAVSAGHCFIMDSDPTHWTVNLGLHYLYGGNVETVQVEKIIIHPQFNIGLVDYDISLIKLSKRIKFSESVQAVCLPKDEKEPKPGKRCVILGWGYTKGTGTEGVLNQGIVPIIDRKQCRKQYRGSITPQMICAGYETGGVDACNGDSGGPLVCQNEGKFFLYGITSWGEDCALPNRPGVYTNVVRFIKWIKENIQEQEYSSITPKSGTTSIKPIGTVHDNTAKSTVTQHQSRRSYVNLLSSIQF